MATSIRKSSKTTSSTDSNTPGKGEPEKETEAAAPRPKKRSLVRILLLLALLLGGAGGGAWYLLQDNPPAADAKPGAGKAAKAAPARPPVFATLESFTVNLQHDEVSPQYLQVGLVLTVADATVADAIKLHTPEIRNRVLLLLSSKRASDISTSEGKQSLSAELVREISQPLAGKVPAQAIDSVLFTSFVIQ